jgi:plastocyanin
MHLGYSRRLPFAILLLLALCAAPGRAAEKSSHLQVIVPEEDRFTPFAQTIHVGDSVKWINMDTDDHTVVSDDFLNTTGRFGLNVLIKGTDNNGGKPGVFTFRFSTPGTFVYYCRFHSHLDAHHQPVAPGPDGGIQADDGNYGTPMMGVITVLPAE